MTTNDIEKVEVLICCKNREKFKDNKNGCTTIS